MPYAWIIDADKLDGTDAGVTGPRGADAALITALQASRKTGTPFKMHDADGELYYTGRLLIGGKAPAEVEFSPLDDFGMPNAGCTSISYRNPETKQWEQL